MEGAGEEEMENENKSNSYIAFVVRKQLNRAILKGCKEIDEK